MFHDTTSFESNMKEDKRSPVPPLTVRKKDGSLYTRFPDVEAEIGEVWSLPPLDWVDRKEKLKSETLVCLICKAGSKDEYVRGLLLEEVNVRSARISEREIKGLDEVDQEEIALEVQATIFDLIWSGVTCAQSEYLEIAFADKVRDLTRNGIDRHKKSLLGHCVELEVWTDPESKKGAFEFVELRQDVIDTRPDMEDILIFIEDEPRRDELLQKIYDAVDDPLDFQALYLFHGEDKSLKEIAALFGTRTRAIRYRKDKAMHQIRVALGLETEEQREAFRKLRAARLAKRNAKSGAKPKVSIRPSSQPPSISI